MKLKGIVTEDFVNYKVPCMTLEFPNCSFKCDNECGSPVCQNSALAQYPNLDIDISWIIEQYINNSITKAICCQGLEPLDSYQELIEFIQILRNIYKCTDTIVIYTGYTKNEIINQNILSELEQFKPIIIKYGRFIPNRNSHYDELLGVNLASPNQFAEEL